MLREMGGKWLREMGRKWLREMGEKWLNGMNEKKVKNEKKDGKLMHLKKDSPERISFPLGEILFAFGDRPHAALASFPSFLAAGMSSSNFFEPSWRTFRFI